MEDFTVPMLATSAYNDSQNQHNAQQQHHHHSHHHQQQQQQQQMQSNLNLNQQHHHPHHQQHHQLQHHPQQHHQATHPSQHHKDHMLATGNAPIVARTLPGGSYGGYDTTPGSNSITTTSSLKSDYAAFTNCIQQSTLLDQRGTSGGTNALDTDSNLDSVSFGGLCDLKFPSPPSSTLPQQHDAATTFTQLDLRTSNSGGTNNNDNNNHSHSLLQQHHHHSQQQTQHSLNAVPSFSNLLFVPSTNAAPSSDPATAINAATSTSNHGNNAEHEYLHELDTKRNENAASTSPSAAAAAETLEPHYVVLKSMSLAAADEKYLPQQQQPQQTHGGSFTNGYTETTTPPVIVPLNSVITTTSNAHQQQLQYQQPTTSTQQSNVVASNDSLLSFQNSFMPPTNSTAAVVTLNSYNNNNSHLSATTTTSGVTNAKPGRKTKANNAKATSSTASAGNKRAVSVQKLAVVGTTSSSECGDKTLDNQITTTTNTATTSPANNQKHHHNLASNIRTKQNLSNQNQIQITASTNIATTSTNNNDQHQTPQQETAPQQPPLQDHHNQPNMAAHTAIITSIHNIADLAASSCNAATTTSSTSNSAATTTSTTITNTASTKSNNAVTASADELLLQQSEHNYSVNSSDCDSMSSDEESIDLEIFDTNGYQDNTSSHSQHSNGGNSVNGGNGSASGSINGGNAGGTALTAAAQAAMGGTAAGYMSLLPPGNNGGGNGGSHLLSSSGNAGGSLIGGNNGGLSGGLVSTGVGVGNGGGGNGGTSANPNHPHGHAGNAGGSNGNGESIDFKHLFEELCPVCGDKVSGYHYGLLTCESCKGFFKRTVQNKKVYTCVAERSCHIDKTQRKRCPFCRFQKCLEVGMKLEAVRADRMRGGRNKFGPMYKRDRARKLQMMRQRQLALQALRTTIGSADMKATPLSPGYQQAYPNMNIKQEIQIPQVSSLTQSPDSSPSPIAIALGQVNASTGVITPMNGGSGGNNGGGGNSGGGGNNNSSNSDILQRGNSGCHDGTGSLPNNNDAKLCFDSGTHPSSTADSLIEPLRVSPMIRDFVQSIDDREWQTQLFALLQKQTYNQVEVDLFELMCKVLDQNLFSQVDWARNTVFFKDLKVDDQMKLLQHSWSDMLVLDHLHQRIHNGLPDETQLNNGQVFNLLGLGLLGVPQLADYFNDLQNKLQELKFDMGDYVCMKFLILLNPDVRGIINKKTVLEGQENVQAALLDYTLTCYPSVTDKFRRLLNILPDIHALAARGEEHLYTKHCAGSAPTQTLLMEMLHAKRKV